jgi:hemoglobin
MYRFWQTILLEVHSTGSLFPPHKHLPVDKNILTAGWKFCSDGKYYLRSIADEAKMRAKNMAEMFNYKINYFRDAAKWQTFKFKIKRHAQISISYPIS